MSEIYNIHVEREICIAHQLMYHTGKCKNLHGHNFKVIVDVEAESLLVGGSDDGMVIDFGTVKNLIDVYDHKNLNDALAPRSFEYRMQPTAERFAKLIATDIWDTQIKANNKNITAISVKVYETERQFAQYTLRR
jgi:6-pyruvoyltetrahydropterin/6-carboxytetrahydropterin synthase